MKKNFNKVLIIFLLIFLLVSCKSLFQPKKIDNIITTTNTEQSSVELEEDTEKTVVLEAEDTEESSIETVVDGPENSGQFTLTGEVTPITT